MKWNSQKWLSAVLSVVFLMGTFNAYAADFISNNEQTVPVLASLSNFHKRMKKVILDENGVLTVVLSGTNDVIIQTLDEATFRRLSVLAKIVSQSEVVIDQREFVCMVVPDPRTVFELKVGNYSVNADAFQPGPLKTILTSPVCSAPRYVHPRERSTMESARILKEELRSLAVQSYFSEQSLDDEVGC